MSKIPVPPKRNYKNRISTQNAPEILSNPISGSGFNVAKKLQDSEWSRPPKSLSPKVNFKKGEKRGGQSKDNLMSADDEPAFIPTLHGILDDTPDVVIGEDVEIKGDFQFDGLLHLKGRFEGRLLSDGDIYVGPKAVLKCNVQNINRMIIDGGHVIGQISVQQLGIAGKAYIKGDIACKFIEINSDDCIILGKVNVHPLAPQAMEFTHERQSLKAQLPPEPSPVAKDSKENKPNQSPVETIEVSTQFADPDEILTPAELALRAKLEAKERRKEAKRQQQEDALRQSKHNDDEEEKEAKEAPSSQAQSPVKPVTTTSNKTEITTVTTPTKKSPIKLVSSDIGSPLSAEEVARLSVPSSPQHHSSPVKQHHEEDSIVADDIMSPQKGVKSPTKQQESTAQSGASINNDDGAEKEGEDTVEAVPMGGMMLPPSPQQRAQQLEVDQEVSSPRGESSSSSSPVKVESAPVDESTAADSKDDSKDDEVTVESISGGAAVDTIDSAAVAAIETDADAAAMVENTNNSSDIVAEVDSTAEAPRDEGEVVPSNEKSADNDSSGSTAEDSKESAEVGGEEGNDGKKEGEGSESEVQEVVVGGENIDESNGVERGEEEAQENAPVEGTGDSKEESAPPPSSEETA